MDVNKYIYGEGGITEDEAIDVLCFRIYNTEEMRKLICYMRDYNAKVDSEDMLSFYGFDM